VLTSKKGTIQFINSAMRYYSENKKPHESRLTLYKLGLVIFRYEQKQAQEYTGLKPDLFCCVAEACQYETLANLAEIATGQRTTYYDSFRYYERPILQGVIERCKVIWQAWLTRQQHNRQMAQFWHNVVQLRHDPENWFIYSGNAYGSVPPDKKTDLLPVLRLELTKIGVVLGQDGKDKYQRAITLDWYGTTYAPSQESVTFIQDKIAQYQRVKNSLARKSAQAQRIYRQAEQRCITHKKPTKSRQTRQTAFTRIGTLDRYSTRAWLALQRYRTEFECEFATIERGKPIL
jgi:hypothetical protein